MKLLVCTDGSENSKKCIEVASEMAGRCSFDEVALIHVYENVSLLPDFWYGSYPFSAEEEKQLQKLDTRLQAEQKKIFSSAEEEFQKNNIPVKTIFKVGHPAEEIAQAAAEGEYDIVVIGRRGRGGVKKLFLGSISNAVLQLVKTNVLIVK